MGVAQLVRKAAKPFAMAAVAGTLGLSLIITTPSNAQAFVPLPVLPAVWGATTMAIPSLIPAAAILGPIGWGAIAIGAIGVGLYSSKDYWLPYVTGTYGQADPSSKAGEFSGSGSSGTIPSPSPSPSPTSTAPPTPVDTGAELGLTVKEVTADGNIISATYAHAGGGIDYGYTAIYQSLAQCKNSSTGAVAYALKTLTQYQSTRMTAWQQTFQMTPCPAGTVMEGHMVGGGFPRAVGEVFSPTFDQFTHEISFGGNAPSAETYGTHGPANVMSFGTFAPNDTDPRTDATKYVTTVECVKPDGTLVSLSAESLGGAGGLTVPSCGAAGLGHGTGKIQVDGFLDGTATPTKLWDVPAPITQPDLALCDPKRSGGGCKLGVSLDGMPCVIGEFLCEHWADVRNDPNYSTRLSCQYGPYQVSMETCNPLERAYEPGGAPATEPNTDGNPGTRFDKQPDGSTQPKPSTDPNTAVQPGTLPGTVPGVGGQPGPSSSPNEAQCFPQGWAMFNPVEWVMKPVGCALAAAFVPNPTAVQARTNSIQTKFQNVGFARVTTAWLSTFEAAGGGSGCSGPTVNFNMSGVNQTLQPFNACSAPMSTVAGVSYGVSAIAMVLFGGLGIARAIAAGFGFNFSMGKGSDV